MQDLDALQNGAASSVGKLLGYDVLGDMDQVITVSVMPGGGGSRQLSVTQVRELTWEEHLKLWKVGFPACWKHQAVTCKRWRECAVSKGQCRAGRGAHPSDMADFLPIARLASSG